MPNFFTLSYWNNLVSAHLSDVVMVITALLLVLVDKPIRKLVNRIYRPKSRVIRFVVFVALYSFGYAGLTILTAKGLQWFLFVQHGAYVAPLALALLIGIGIAAANQKLI